MSIHDQNKEKHESYGLVGFSRMSGCEKDYLFGSSVKHHNTIRLRIQTAGRDRHLSNHWYHADKPIVEVDLSPTQFADLLTSMNVGEGVPCTIRSLNGKRMEDCPAYDQRAQFEDEFEETVKEANQKAADLCAQAAVILKKTTILKVDRETLLKLMEGVMMAVKSSMPFVQGTFNAAMDKTITEAKGEVEAFVQNKIISLGIEALRDEVKANQVEFIDSPKQLSGE